MRFVSAGFPAMVVAGLVTAADARAGVVTLEDRIAAQEAIERVYHAHQIGASLPFEEAVPRNVLRAKVERALRLSAALERYWKTPVTADMLRAEVERMVREGRMPDRLRELFDALGDDPVAIQECLARPALVERLARSFFLGSPPPGARRNATIWPPDDPARAWDSWWSSVEPSLDPASVGVVATGDPSWEALPSAPPCSTSAAWDPGSLDDGPDRRAHTVAVWTGSLMLVWGGDVKTNALGTGFRYDPATDSWDGITTLGAPEERADHVAVWTGSRLIVWGGSQPTETGTRLYLTSGGIYDPVADAWTPMTSVGSPSGRARATAVWTGTEMIVWGGEDLDELGDGARYDPASDRWTPITGVDAPQARAGHSAVWTGAEMVVWGGAAATNELPTGGRYDPATDAWDPTDLRRAPGPRTGHSAIWTGSHMIVWGGWSSTMRDDGASYDPRRDRWTALSLSGAPEPRGWHTAIWTGARMIVWGGLGAGTTYPETGASYDPGTDTWSATGVAGAPEGRYGQVAVWSGSRMIVWGGLRVTGEMDSGGRYDPSTDSWTPTALPRGPAPRSGAVSAWTGNRLLIWGGWDGAKRGDGGAYDPALDTWFSMSSVDAPAPRRRHTGVWTGARFIVWGGDAGAFTAPTATGGEYDPITDSWIPTSEVGAPEARVDHTAVWSGREMIVWGGGPTDSSGWDAFASGGRYDPVARSWSPTDIGTAPSFRTRHVAVWTGREMVVFGGAPPQYPPTGGRYEPRKDRWRPTIANFSPSGIGGVPAVWTGKYMVVWNGYGTPDSQQGGRYDPARDEWLPMAVSTTGNLRTSSASAWTGREMVVWGGDRFYSHDTVGDGARYDPATDVWTSLPADAAPVRRAGHVLVAGGDVVVNWGGRRSYDSDGSPLYHQGGSRLVLDRDDDGTSDLCDPDDDGDGTPDAIDCAPGDADTASPAAPVGDLRVHRTWVEWTPQDSGTTYDVASGSLETLRSLGTFGGGVCLATYEPASAVADPRPAPTAGAGYWYLVRAVNVCADSGWGDAGGADRPVAACP